jgi:hypothetical protein
MIANQSLRLIISWKALVSISRQQARRMDREHPEGITLGGRTAIIITILSAAVIITGGIAASNWYSSWKKDLDGTFLFVVPGQIKETFSKENPFGIDLFGADPGNLPAEGLRSHERFEYPNAELTAEEENRLFRSVDAETDDPLPGGSGLFPHDTNHFFTAEDKRMTKEQWDDFKAGKHKTYLLGEFKYLVGGYIKITEFCAFWQNTDFPSAHKCRGHNNWHWKE